MTRRKKGASVKGQIVRIGNSQGIRIPKVLIEQTGLSKQVEIFVQDDSLVIRPARPVREGWEAAFQEMARLGDDALLDAGSLPPTRWDEEEWEW